MAGAAQGFAAEKHGAPLFQGTAGAHPHALYVAVREQAGREAGPSDATSTVKAPQREPMAAPDQVTVGRQFRRCKFALVIAAVPVHHVSAAFLVSWGGAGESGPSVFG
jgi:hypothetical protein